MKKIRRRIDDDDDMLYYLKYSHLEPIREDDILGIDKATQYPDIMNNFTQTDKKDMKDKETDTYDELNTIDPPYYLTLSSNNFKSKEASRAEKMAQVWSTTVEKKTPPSSDSQDDDEGFMSRNVDRGLRMAQMTGSAMLQALNIADTVGSAVLSPVIDSALDYLMSNPSNENEEEEEEEEEEVPTSSVDAPQVITRERSKSRDSDDDLGNRLLRRQASRSRSSSPASSGKASSAKTTPKKK